ncbi:LuxR C-terminal-related transcriptional regulator [Pseudarthrobacter sulfonivorans]|uniref:LuxR C-terminal-related transcriptional regulator n=1 Tax=Pseudarthrobacter sulfonivorans TaxID=121292 RepID=UPI002861637E|nr:LuxR C-terminal-related transcriptional regulator [Pseudarthrobacter sulfonivorans]MDR6416085.1 ATP/maltotriose-dependent transcriptional regulator MalT [Pseudarthrobacter sulfonivorans]
MPELDELLTSGREAFVRRDWAAANSNLAAARANSHLATGDLDALASSAWWLGNVPESLAVSEELYRHLAGEGDHTGAAMTAIELSLRWSTRGDLAVASGWLNRARRMLAGREHDPEYGYLLYMEASMSLDFEPDQGTAALAARGVEALSHGFDDPALRCFARVLSGIVLVRDGRTEAGFNEFDEAMLPVLAGQVPPEWAGDIYCTVVHLCHALGDFARMRAWTRALEQWAAGISTTFVYAHVTRVHELQLLSTEGKWEAVLAEIGPLSDKLATAHGWMAGAGFYELGEIRRLRGDAAGARDAYARSRGTGVEPQPGEALLRYAAGERHEALEQLRIALAETSPLERVRLLLPATELALASGQQNRAAAYCSELEQTAVRFASPGLRAWAHHAKALVLLSAGRARDALTAVEAAARIYREQRARYGTARLHELAASCRMQLGEAEAATADRATALAIYRQLGAVPDVRRLDAEAPGGLTAREAEVLALVCGGTSNRQIAQSLVISEKTVGRHLANIFMKIGVTSRTAAAGWARAHGLA